MPTKTHLSPIESTPADYSVVLITNDTNAHIQKFIKVQSFLGASEFFIYVDRDFNESRFGRLENVSFISTQTFYAERARPESFFDVQEEIYQDAYERCKTTWLAVMDTDECIFHPHVSMDDFLNAIPSQTEFIRASTHEAFWGSFDRAQVEYSADFCRCPGKAKLVEFEKKSLFGNASKLGKARGSAGHAAGKYLVKTGLDMDLRIHFSYHRAKSGRIDFLSELGVLHFDARSFALWHEKFGAGKANGIGAQHKQLPHRKLLIDRLDSRLFQMSNVQVFKALYCWSARKRKQYLEFGDIYSLSWKWGALWNFGSLSKTATHKYLARRKRSLMQRLMFAAKASPYFQWTRPIAKALRLV